MKNIVANNKKIVGWCSNSVIYEKIAPEVRWAKIPATAQSLRSNLVSELQAKTTLLGLVPVPIEMVPDLAKRGFLKSLTSIIPKKVLEYYDSGILNLCSYKELLYAVPDDFQVYALAERDDGKTKRTPVTWRDFENSAKAARGYYLGIQQRGMNNRMGFILSLLLSNGVEIFQSGPISDKEAAKTAESYEWLRRITVDLSIMDLESVTRPIALDAVPDFANGSLPCWAGWISKLEALPLEKKIGVKLFSFPRGPSFEKARVLLRGRAWCIPGNTLMPENAVKALLRLLKPETVKMLELTDGNCFPAQKSLRLDSEIINKRPLVKYATELIKGELVAFDFSREKVKYIEEKMRGALSEELTTERFLLRLKGKEKGAYGHPVIRRAIDYIEENIGKIGKISEISEAVGMSRAHLNVLFLKELRENTGEYLLRRRMELAREYLTGTNDSVKAVAFRLGFRSSSYFSRTYSKYWNISPSSVRNLKK